MGGGIDNINAAAAGSRRRRAAVRTLAVIAGANVALFIILRLIAIADPHIAGRIVEALALPADGAAGHPWAFISYMFIQYDPLHITLNMLWLAWFWLLGADNGRNALALLSTFIAGGVAGGVAYVLTASEGILLGSSGAVMAIVAAVAVANPSARTGLPFLRRIYLLPLAAVILLIYIACRAFGSPASHTAHLAGIAAGIIAGMAMRLTPKKIPAAQPTPSASSSSDILAKLRSSGYASLSPAEREALARGQD